MIRFMCPNCQASLKAAEAYAGKSVVCKKCGIVLTVPDAAPPARRPVESVIDPAGEATVVSEEGLQWNTLEDSPDQPAFAPAAVPEDLLSPNGDVPVHEVPMDVMVSEPEPEPITAPAPKRPFGVIATLLGLPGAAAFFVGVFLPLFEVNGKSLLANDWRLWLVQSGGILLGLVALGLIVTRRYAGLWVLGPGSLLSFLAAYGLLYARAVEEHGMEKAMLLRPGYGFLILLGGALLLTLAVIVSPRRKRYEYPGY
ncbi:MAG: hypothetical protein NZM31_13940 [Gemmatales bacterium]|nr:hypothetical protein [Gemmatales bacterium]MDW8388097.1 hypothetical protein [Gemmatales bacterium]